MIDYEKLDQTQEQLWEEWRLEFDLWSVFTDDVVTFKVRHEYGGAIVDRQFDPWRELMGLTVNVKVHVLKDLVTKARQKHKEDYEKMLQLWNEKTQAWVAKWNERFQSTNGEQIKPQRLDNPAPVPSCHLETYDRALEMLELHQDNQDCILLQVDDYRRFVQDQWDFSREFAHTKASYGLD